MDTRRLSIAAALVALALVPAWLYLRVPDRNGVPPTRGAAGADSAATEAEPAPARRPGVPTDAEKALAAIDQTIAFHRERAEKQPGWLDYERVAIGYLSRAHLTGSYDDYAAAEAALERAFKVAPAGAGPWLTRARLDFTLHRFAATETSLKQMEKAILLKDDETRAIAEMRADMLFYSGAYATARAAYEQALAVRRTVTSLSRMAQYFWKTGDFTGADALLKEAEAAAGKGEGRAWVLLQRGLLCLDQGRYACAYEHYKAAGTAFAGWYLIEEHIAEIKALEGEHESAKCKYERLVESTANPEFMAALAGVYRELGKSEESSQMLARAREGFEKLLAQYPEAAYGHALEFFIEHGPHAKAVELARKNVALRPNGESKAQLAAALMAAGQPGEAASLVTEALATPYRSADLHAVAAQAYASTGKSEAAGEQARLARAINPASGSSGAAAPAGR